jgi:hypothetical protein
MLISILLVKDSYVSYNLPENPQLVMQGNNGCYNLASEMLVCSIGRAKWQNEDKYQRVIFKRPGTPLR